MPKVHFVTEQVTVDVPQGTTIREVAEAQGIEIYRGMWTHLNCLGNGVCGRCKIWVLTPSAEVSPRTVRERFHRISGKQRLACQVKVLGDVEIRTRPIGPAVVREDSTAFAQVQASYKEAAAQRYVEAKAEAEAKAKAEAAKKAKAEAEAKAKAKAKAEAEAKAKAEAEAKAKAEAEAEASADGATSNGEPAKDDADGASAAAAAGDDQAAPPKKVAQETT